MTNRHVAEIFASGLGDRSLSFITGGKAGVDFLREEERPTGPTIAVHRIVMIHPHEFAVPEEFAPAAYPIADIEAMTNVRFDPAIREADQYDSVRGAEVAMRSGARTKQRN